MKNLRCKDCTARYVGCHSECEHYIEWKKEHEAERARINEIRKQEGIEIADSIHRLRKMRKKKDYQKLV